jgi:hypothetical protein
MSPTSKRNVSSVPWKEHLNFHGIRHIIISVCIWTINLPVLVFIQACILSCDTSLVTQMGERLRREKEVDFTAKFSQCRGTLI